MYFTEYRDALSTDSLHHAITFLISAGTVFLIMYAWGKDRINEATSALHIEKNDQFRTAITTSIDEIYRIKDHHSKLAHDAEESGNKKTRKEHYPRYVFYTGVISYSLALKKHGWKEPISLDSTQSIE
jgi:hypothetical protein